MKKSLVRYISLGIVSLMGVGGLLSLSSFFGTGSNNQIINNKDNNNVSLRTSVNNRSINRNSINTEGTPLPTSGTLSSGTYYLSSDLTVSSQLKITSGDVIVNLNGFTLNGGGRDKGIFYVTGGTLTVNGKDDETGNRGTLNNGGGYYPGSGYSYGGALYITAGGATLNDLDITNCQANWGGAIHMSKSAVTLNNCNLSNNIETNGYGYYGAISVGDSSTAGAGLTVNGGEMFSNNAAIYLGSKAKVTINGTYIHDNDYYGVRVETNNGEGGLTISGNTIIKDNNNSSPRNLSFNNNNVAKVGIVSELGNDAYIGVTISGATKGVFTNSVDTSLNDASKFFSDDSNYAVAKNSDGQLYLAEGVATVTSGETVTEYSTFTDAVSAWNSAASGATLTLLKDATVDSSISVSGTKTFDLNGCGINANGSNLSIFTVASGGDLTLNDSGSTTHYYTLADVESNGAALATICDQATYEAASADARGTFTGGYLTGAIPQVNAAPYPGGGIYILENGVATMNGGTIIGNIASNCAGGVGSNGKFIMNDGNIIYNRSRRGAVLASAGEMIINGGHISYNTGRGTDSCGTDAVITYPNCTNFIINGGYITNNFARYAGIGSNTPTISISGNPVIKDNIGCGTNGTDTTEINVLLSRRSNLNVYFDIVGELTEGAEIGVSIENSHTGVLTNSSDISYNDVSKFFSDDANYDVAKNNDGQLYLKNAVVATVTSGETVTEYSTFAAAVSAWTDGTTLTLLKDISTSDTINVNNNVTLDLNGHGIKATGSDYSVLTINDGGKLIIIDSGDTTQYFTIADRYEGNGAGFATVCDKATYDATSEDTRGTFQGGYITGGNIISTGFYQYKAGAITVLAGGELDFKAGTIIGNSGGSESPGGVSLFGTVTLNGGNIIYNRGRRGSGVFVDEGTFLMNSGSIEYNTGVGASEYGTAALHSYGSTKSISLKGGSISHNYAKYGGILTPINIFLSGDFVAANNVACGSSGTEAANGNIILSEGALISGCIDGNTPIGISLLNSGSGVFTNNTDTSLNDPSKFVSDNPNYAIGVYPTGHDKAGQLFIGNKVSVTYTTEYGSAPVSDTVANGSIIYNEPTSLSEEGYEFKGWYKDEEFENAWDFETDTVTSDTTLYAKWYDEATANVIKLINDIGELTYDGGVNDSLNDIIAAKAAYDALTPSQKALVDKENKDVLDHDIYVYDRVDNVGDLIKEIPEASNTDDYYNAVEAAKAAYDDLNDVEQAILGDAIDFSYEKALEDNIKVEEVIKIIDEIGEVTYNGGQNDSKDDIISAEEAYNNLTEEQKNIVNNVNKDVLDDSKDLYDKVDETVKLIESIGDVSHGGESDSKEAIEAAKEAFDSLTSEEQALVSSYNNSEKVLEDDEAVYGAMEAIDSIGEVTYTAESEEAIKHAQEVYDSLTEDQKEQLGEVYKNILIESKNKYETASKQGDILFLILLIVTLLALVGGIWFLFFLIKKKKKDEDDDDSNVGGSSKKEPVKAYSFGGLLTSLILVSHYLDTKYIILYVLASLAIAIWIACLIVALTHKRKMAVKEENKPQQVKESAPQEINEDEEEVETITDEKGNVFQIRFIKSFTAKLIQAPEETKKYYEELKNEVLSYKGTHSRISWHFDSVNAGRNYVLKFAIRGKTLCLYLPLDSENLEDKYKVEKVESKKFEDVPCLYRIKNDRRKEYAKELIAMVASNLGLEKGEEQHEVYSNLPYEENKPLIARGLIKELKVKVNKPAEAPIVLESKVNSEGDEVVLTKDSNGNLFEIRYIKSFTAKLSQSEAEVKDYYSVLKNYVLSYKGVHSRVSWHYDAINVSRDYILKFAIRGKTLCLYYDLETSKLDKKYKVEEAKGKKFEDVPCLYRIKNDRRCEYAKELIDLLMKEHDLNQGDVPNEDYRIKKESTKALLDKGLIKEVKSKIHDKKVIEHYESITVSKADEVMSDEKAESSIEEVEVNKHKEGSKVIINIDTLSEHYNNGDEVTLDSLIEKGLVPSKVGHIKVLARGELDKKLHVVANEYSLQAIKMIVLVGGTVKKIK